MGFFKGTVDGRRVFTISLQGCGLVFQPGQAQLVFITILLCTEHLRV